MNTGYCQSLMAVVVFVVVQTAEPMWSGCYIPWKNVHVYSHKRLLKWATSVTSVCEINPVSFCLWKEMRPHIIAMTPWKKSSGAGNNQPSHNAHTGEKARDQERRKDREGSSNYSHFLTPSWFGCRHCLWTHLETLLYNYSLTHALMSPNKRGRGLTYHSLTNGCNHFLLLRGWNEHKLVFIVPLCQVCSFQQPRHSCWDPSTRTL